jgi:hypothetical protein
VYDDFVKSLPDNISSVGRMQEAEMKQLQKYAAPAAPPAAVPAAAPPAARPVGHFALVVNVGTAVVTANWNSMKTFPHVKLL